MFVDIRSFTARSAHLSPTKAVGLLNEFLRAMVDAVEGEHGGMINKFLGDGFMALFGIGSDSRNHADKALRSEEHTSELQSLRHLVCRLLLEKKKKYKNINQILISNNNT